MGVAGQIGENLLGSCEGSLGVDDPLALSNRHEPVGKGLGIGQIEVIAEELQVAFSHSLGQLELMAAGNGAAGPD
jgi:hypothetical protein